MSLEHVGKGVDDSYTGNPHPFMRESLSTKMGVMLHMSGATENVYANGQHYYGQQASITSEQTLAFHRRVLSSPVLQQGQCLAASVPLHTPPVYLNGLPAPRYLWRECAVVPFATFQYASRPAGADEWGLSTSVELPALVESAAIQGFFGVVISMRLPFNQPNVFPSAVRKLFVHAQRVLDAGLVPLLDIDHNGSDTSQAQQFLSCLEKSLDTLGDCHVVLSLPLLDDVTLLDNLFHHPNVLRLMVSANNLPAHSALALFNQQPFAVPNISAATFEGLSVHQARENFDATLRSNLSALLRHRARY